MIVRLVTSAILAVAFGAAVAVNQESSSGQAAVVKATGREARAHDGELRTFAISPDGQTLASGGSDKKVRLWSLPQGDALRTLSGHAELFTGLAFTPDSRLLATASEDKTVSLWSVGDGRRVTTLRGHSARISAVRVTPDGSHILTQAGGELRIWSLPDGRLEKTSPNAGDLNRAVITPDSRFLATLHASWQPAEPPAVGDFRHAIALWSLPELQQVAILENPSTGQVKALAITPDGATLVAVRSKDIVLWSLADRRSTQVASDLEGAEPPILLAPDGRTLVGGCGTDGSKKGTGVCVWNLWDGRQIAAAKGHSSTVRALALSPDGRVVASGSEDYAARLWSLPDGRPIAVLEGYRGVVEQLLFTPDGTTLITGHTKTFALTFGGGTFAGGWRPVDAVIGLWSVSPPAFRRYLAK